MLDTLRSVLHYLAHLEWTEKKQHCCKFCDETNFERVIYKDDHLIAVNNIRNAGDAHWLIMPRNTHDRRHIRDIEALGKKDIPLLEAMDKVKQILLHREFPNAKPHEIHSGYHRGRRQLFGKSCFSSLLSLLLPEAFSCIFWPDIVSVHHLHLHVIVRPRSTLVWFFKYPAWCPLMWVSDRDVVRRLLRGGNV